MQKIITFLIVLTLSTNLFVNAVFSNDLIKTNDELINVSADSNNSDNSPISYEVNSSNISLISTTGVITNTPLNNRENVVFFNENESYAEFSIDIKTEGFYNINFEYCSITDTNGDFETKILINNELPFPFAENIKLKRRYVDIQPISKDANGNDLRPEKKEEKIWIAKDLEDLTGMYTEPLLFKFKQGNNFIRIEALKAGFALSKILIHNNSKNMSYKEYLKTISDKKDLASDLFEKTQGENSKAVSNTFLYPTYDKSSAITEPQDSIKLRLNTIGQRNWKMPGEWIEWEINVPKSGLYNIGMRVRQNYIRGNYSYRRMLIDGKILYDNMQDIRFPYNTSWYIKNLGDNEPEFIYLEEGKHLIRMEVIAGYAGKIIAQFNNVIIELNTLYRKMIMITGINPDPYRDYKLDNDIPQLLSSFKKIYDDIQKSKNEILGFGIKSGSDAVVIEKLAVQIQSFIQKPDSIPFRLEDFRNNISSVSSWLVSLKEQPLEVDYLFIVGKNKKAPVANSNFLDQLSYRLSALVGSFFNNYSLIANETKTEKSKLNVWVNLGRDQAQIIKDLTQNFFEKDGDYNVNISLVQQGLTEAIASGKGPDVVLFTNVSDSVNFASRGALEDLSKYSNFKEVEKRFLASSFSPFEFNNGIYGIPLNQGFNMMFYRTDIFKELDINPPKTWDEFYNVLTIIQKNHLLVGMPVGNINIPDNSVFDMLLFQNNGNYYNSNFSKTDFESDAALTAFKQWTNFYSKYSLPLSYDFYNRFRSSEMPLGITNYNMYNMLSVAAPEIKGLWEMLPVPGTVQNDGKINNTTSGGATGLIVLKSSKNKQGAFKYIDWFTSTKIQTEYGISVENIFGQAGRYDPANIEALKAMNWDNKTLKELLSQINNLKMAPQIPASYEVTRSLTNAFRSVVIGGNNPRESLFTYNDNINAEISRKLIELDIK